MEERLHCGACPVAPLFERRIPAERNQRTNNNYFNQQPHMKGKFSKASSEKQPARTIRLPPRSAYQSLGR